MLIKQQVNKHILCSVLLMLFITVFSITALYAQKKIDSTQLLKKVIITGNKKQNGFTTAVPVQLMNHEILQQLNAESIGDAAKYFSGVLIKDYGGVGGLKTISVRSLGALNTGLLYDGIPVADMQSGQIDLSKFSSTFVQSLELDQANPQQILLPARVYSSAAVLTVSTNSFNTTSFTQEKWQAGIKQGSFGLWQPFAGIYLPTGKNIVICANAEATWDKGDYPYYIPNGMFSQKEFRINSDVQAFQGEVNVVKQFADSSQLQTKAWGYSSARGLPGSLIYFNNISVQRLWDEDLFAQSRYQKKISAYTSLLVSVKYSSMFTKYEDPNFNPTPSGIPTGLDDRYIQQEIYASAALSQRVGKYISMSVASDIASTHLSANITPFAMPTRISMWNSFAIQYARRNWQINGSLLNTNINDKTEIVPAATNKNVFTPTIAASYKQSTESPFLFRFFYKDIFRMPTFNDLYYTYISNIIPKLLPEYSQQYNAGITYSKNYTTAIKQLNISVDGYYNSVKNKIITIPGPNLLWTTESIGKVQIKGVDINGELNGKFSSTIKWSARIAYTWQQALDVTDPTNGEYKNEIPYTPQNSGSALVIVYYKKWDAGYSFLFSGNRFTLGANDPSNELPGWGTHDVFVSRLIQFQHFQASIKGEIDNLFNELYDVINYYPMPGRSYKISITFNNL
jgi:vitamin B12 transporter